jgi:hypothetical protein
MPIWGAIAAKRYAACLAGAQMDPRGTNLHAFLAFTALRLLHCFNRAEMRTTCFRHYRTLFAQHLIQGHHGNSRTLAV